MRTDTHTAEATPTAGQGTGLGDGEAGTGTAVATHGVAGPGNGILALVVRPGARLESVGSGSALRISTPKGAQTLTLGDAAVVEALVSLQDEARSATDLMLSVTSGGGGLARVGVLQAILNRLQASSVLDHVVFDAEGSEVARLTGGGSLPVVLKKGPPSAGRLSRLAVLTLDDGRVVVQSGLSHMKVVLDQVAFSALLSQTLMEGSATGPSVARLLDSAGVWDCGDQDDLAHRQWNPADLWFHQRVNEAAGSDAYGGTFHMAAEFDPPEFARPATSRTLTLPTPDLDGIRRDDPPLGEVVEKRRSIRDFAEDPLTLAELGELLYRSCRARGVFREEHGLDVVDRPYPSGGSVHELDVYAVAPGSAELDRGLWRYAPDRHELDLISDQEKHVDPLIRELQGAAMLARPAPLGLLITARFGRLMWKYETMAYSLILKHTGALYQTLYLNGTAMGLGICGLGGASTTSFAIASGESPLVEGVVGGLVAGRPGSVPESPWSAL